MDTSMGFTPTGGVPMSTRSGDLDPGLVWYLARTEKITAKKFNEMVISSPGCSVFLKPVRTCMTCWTVKHRMYAPPKRSPCFVTR